MRGSAARVPRAWALPLRLLPSRLREAVGEEIVELWRERLGAARREGRAAVCAYLLSSLLDLVRTALRSHSGRSPSVPPATVLPPPSPAPRTPDMFLHDLRFALRTLAHRPAFTFVVVLTLALGISANTVIYTAVSRIIFNPFGFPDPDRVLAIGVEYPRLNQPLGFFESISAPEYADVVEQSTTLERLVAFDIGNRQITGGDVPENLRTGFWWGDPLPTLGLSTLHGRGFSPQDMVEGTRVALISERTWRSRFAADPEVVGRTIQINGVDTTLIGVFPSAAIVYGIDLWTPMWAAPEVLPRARRQFNVLARLPADTALTRVNVELETLARRTEAVHGAEFEEYGGWRIVAMTFTDANVRSLKPAGNVLLASVAFVLLLVCSNVASLVLARSAGRRREMAVRAALGAGRGRLIRQLVSESMMLALMGGALGVGLAWLGLRGLVAVTPAALLPLNPMQLDPGALGYTALISVVAGLLFGLAPALQASRVDLHTALAQESTQSTGSRSRRRLHGVFVAGEVALALVLLTGAGLFINSFARLQRVDPGVDVDDVLTMRLTLPWERFEGQAITDFFVQLADRVEAIPGVSAAASGSQFSPIGFVRRQFSLPDQVVDDDSELPTALLTIASTDYFETLGIPLRAGRPFNALDQPGPEMVAVINEEMARRHFAGAKAVGRRLKLGTLSDPNLPWLEVVGIAADTKNRGLDAPTQPEIYVSLRQVDGIFNQLFLIVRSEGARGDLLPAIREAVASLDPEQPIYAIGTLRQAFSQGFAIETFAMALLSVFAGLALILAAVGISGVVAYAVSERHREIGVRLALGAGGSQVRRLIVRQALLPVAIGGVIGLVGALALGRAIGSMLFEIGGNDPGTLAAVALVLGAVGLLAGYVPALRASGIDPVVSLRAD